ncbi:hypothetical protein MKX08_005726 [Trichoderma sp. CBMAI-0020]|nr:hypothetical protein MKX08_005726 [Trichoderma sp. CBMAI-0020]
MGNNNGDIIAYIYPAVGTLGLQSAQEVLELNQGHPGYTPPRHFHTYDRKTLHSESLNTRAGLYHFALTFDDSYHLVVRDLWSTSGTTVVYGQAKRGPWSNFSWIVGGSDFLKGVSPIIVMVQNSLQFRLVIPHHDIQSKLYRDKVDRYRAGCADVQRILSLDNVGLSTQARTAFPSGIFTSAKRPPEAVTLRRKFGEGSFAFVYRVWVVETGLQYALKKPKDLTSIDRVDWEREAFIMERAKHALDALTYLHSSDPQIVHRDIKPNNILILHRRPNDIAIKLADFGLAYEGETLRTLCGTYRYIAPEIHIGANAIQRSQRKAYTALVDVWSLGVVLAELLCGLPKHNRKYNIMGLSWCESISEWVELKSRTEDDEMLSFVLNSMLRLEPDDRMTAADCYKGALDLVARTQERNCDADGDSEDDEGTVRVDDKIGTASRDLSIGDSSLSRYIISNPEQSANPAKASSLHTRTSTVHVGQFLSNFRNLEDSLFYEFTFGKILHEGYDEDSETASTTRAESQQRVEQALMTSASEHVAPVEESLLSPVEWSKFDNDDDAEIKIEEMEALMCSESQALASLKRTSAATHPVHLEEMEALRFMRLLPVDEALSVAPEELEEFVKQNYDKKRHMLLIDNIPDWEDVSQEKRDLLDEKLQAAMRKAITHSVDPEDLAARLAQVPSERGSPIRQMVFPESPEDIEFEPQATPQEYQARCYQALLEEGGRPLFDVELLPQTSANVGKYKDLLRPWRQSPDGPARIDWEVFHRQLCHWEEFRVSQLWHRGRTLGFSEFVDKRRRFQHMMGGYSKSRNWAEYEQILRSLWKHEHGESHPKPFETDDDAKAGILEYNNAMKKLLEHYGFVQPFQLHLDIKEQDQWTTFVEYLGFECHNLYLLTESTQRMRPERAAEREESAEVEVMAPSAKSTTSQHKRVYEPEGDATVIDDPKETHGQRAKKQKQSETRVNQEEDDEEQWIPFNPALSPAALDREYKYLQAKARVAYHQHRVEWIRSEISKIEAEQKSKETKVCEGKPASEASTDASIVESGPTDEGKMSNRKNDDFPTAQVVELNVRGDEAVPENEVVAKGEAVSEDKALLEGKANPDEAVPEDESVSENKASSENKAVSKDKVVSEAEAAEAEAVSVDKIITENKASSEHKVVPESQIKTNNKPSTENPSFVKSKDVSTQFYDKGIDVDLGSAAVVSAQVSPTAMGDSQETCDDEPKALQSALQASANEHVAVTASTSSEANETQTPKGSTPSHASDVV